MVVFGFRIEPDLKRWIVQEARRRNVTVQELATAILSSARSSIPILDHARRKPALALVGRKDGRRG